LKSEIESTYAGAQRLMNRVDPSRLGWKPQSGRNWMTVSQLLKHLTDACGAPFKGLVTGDWGLPEGMKMEDLSPEQMLPPAEKLPGIESVEEAQRLLSQDKALALRMIDQAGEENLANRQVSAPWAPGVTMVLGRYLLQMIQHLDKHKSQLFYYLKLQGEPVNTADLYS